MAIITGTPNDRWYLPDGTVVNPPPGFPFAGDVDLISALAGNDDVAGGLGDDTAILGDGDDRFTWDPGEGSDDVEGGRGSDTLEFNGSDASSSSRSPMARTSMSTCSATSATS